KMRGRPRGRPLVDSEPALAGQWHKPFGLDLSHLLSTNLLPEPVPSYVMSSGLLLYAWFDFTRFPVGAIFGLWLEPTQMPPLNAELPEGWFPQTLFAPTITPFTPTRPTPTPEIGGLSSPPGHALSL